MNALNASKKLDEIAHKGVSEVVKMRMIENEALECQNYIPSHSYVP